MPQRTRSKCAAGSRSIAALLAACSEQRRDGARAAARPRPRSARAARRRTRRRARRRWRSASSRPPARAVGRRGGRRRRASPRSGSRVPEAAHAGVELDVHARRAAGGDQRLTSSSRPRPTTSASASSATRSSSALERTEHEDAARRCRAGAQLARLAAPWRPPATSRRRRSAAARPATVAVAVAVGLDDRAERGAFGALALQPRDVALDRGEVDPRQRPQRAHCSRVMMSRRSARAICRAGV